MKGKRNSNDQSEGGREKRKLEGGGVGEGRVQIGENMKGSKGKPEENGKQQGEEGKRSQTQEKMDNVQSLKKKEGKKTSQGHGTCNVHGVRGVCSNNHHHQHHFDTFVSHLSSKEVKSETAQYGLLEVLFYKTGSDFAWCP
ncbi:uncharacterized protein LOC140708461 [Pogona vitticeps]